MVELGSPNPESGVLQMGGGLKCLGSLSSGRPHVIGPLIGGASKW